MRNKTFRMMKRRMHGRFSANAGRRQGPGVLMRNKTFAAREHPHPNPLPQAGEGAGHCSLSRLRERAGVRVVDQQSPSVSLRTPGAARGLGCSQAKAALLNVKDAG